MILIDGKKIAAELREELKKEVSSLKTKYNKVPGLSVILIGDLTPSQIYVKNKEKFANEVGLKSEVIKYPDSVTEKVILDKISELNNDVSVYPISSNEFKTKALRPSNSCLDCSLINKNFGIVSGPGDAVDAVFRKNGFVDHISEKEDLKLVWEYKGDFSSESGRDAFNDYKNQNIPDMAIFGCNDHTCFGFMKEALEAGFKIPKDFIIAGYDNLSFCENFTPELTSVATNFDILGKRAIRTIENMVNDSNEIIRQFSMVPVEIVIRSSTQN